MNRPLRHKLLAGGVALVVAGSAGGAYAATQSGANPRQAFLNDVAKRLNVSPAQLRTAVDGALLDRLSGAVRSGQLTQAQANRIRQRIEQGRGLPLGPLGGPMWRHGFGPMGHGFGPMGPGGGLGRHALLPTVASYLGLSPAQLVSELRSGKSLAQIAQAQNKSVSGLEQAMMTAARTRLASLVSSGVLTTAQEQRLLNRLSARISRLVNAHPRLFRGVPGGPVAGGPPPLLPSPPVGGPGAPPPPGA